MNLNQKIKKIFLNAVPTLLMIGLILPIKNDYYLTIVFAGIIVVSFLVKKEKGDISIFLFGFLIMTFFELIFVSTGVETFTRNTLFNLIPLWLPFIWGYGFVAIRRALKILE